MSCRQVTNPPKPHICYVHQYFRTPEMSGGTRSYEIARRLVAAGYEVTLLTARPSPPQFGTPLWCIERIDGISVCWYRGHYRQEMRFWRRMLAYCGFIFAAGLKSRSLKAHLVYASSTPLTVALVGIFLKLIHGVPFIFEVRDVWPEVPIAMGELRNPLLKVFARVLEKVAYRSSCHIVALSPDMKKAICQAGISPKKVSVVPNGCDLARPHSLGKCASAQKTVLDKTRGRPYLIYAGSLGQVNNVTYLAALAAQLYELKSDLCIVIVGAGSERDSLERDAMRRGVLENNLFIFPPVEKSCLAPLIGVAFAGISTVQDIPALSANSANKVFDYFAHGLPIIINHGGWLADLITQEGCGLVLSPRCTRSDAEAVDAFAKDPQRYEQASAVATQMSRTIFARDAQVKSIEWIIAGHIALTE